MQTISKENLDVRLGTLSAVFPQQLPGALHYRYGLAAVDALPNPEEPTHLRLNVRPAGIELYLRNHETVLRLGLPFADITAIELKSAVLLANPAHPSVLRRMLARQAKGKFQEALASFTHPARALLTLVAEQDGVESFVVAAAAAEADVPAMQRFLYNQLASVYRA